MKPHSKTLLLPIISNLSDKQTLIRNEAMTALDKFSNVVGSDIIINCMVSYLTEDSIELRKSIILWILNNPEGFKKSEIKNFVHPILHCLIDKNKEIRTITEKLLELAVEDIGTEPFNFAT